MFELSLNDTASAALAAMPERIAAGLAAKANVLAAELQAKTENDRVVCANVFGLWWSQRPLAMMDSARSLPY